MPMLPPVGERMAVLTPITSPSCVNSGPPELPWLMAASTCRNWSYGPAPISRPSAEMIPAVTVPPRPNGLPTATTHWPGRTWSELPSFSEGSGWSACTRSTARSVRGSRPTTLAGSWVPSSSVTVNSFPAAATWLLVTIVPSELTMKPEPRASRWLPSCLTVTETTAGRTWATRSAKSGIGCAVPEGSIGRAVRRVLGVARHGERAEAAERGAGEQRREQRAAAAVQAEFLQHGSSHRLMMPT